MDRPAESPASELGPSWREENAAAGWLLIGLGVFLAVLPFVTGSGPDDHAWTDVAAGACVALLALVRMAVPGMAWVAIVIALIGVFVAISGFALHDRLGQEGAITVCGILIVLLAVWSAGAPARRS